MDVSNSIHVYDNVQETKLMVMVITKTIVIMITMITSKTITAMMTMTMKTMVTAMMSFYTG